MVRLRIKPINKLVKMSDYEEFHERNYQVYVTENSQCGTLYIRWSGNAPLIT